jgi:hypothetical protein
MQVWGILGDEQKQGLRLVDNMACVSILNNGVHRNARELKPFHRIPVGFRCASMFMMEQTMFELGYPRIIL